jgi:hypothetical protein
MPAAETETPETLSSHAADLVSSILPSAGETWYQLAKSQESDGRIVKLKLNRHGKGNISGTLSLEGTPVVEMGPFFHLTLPLNVLDYRRGQFWGHEIVKNKEERAWYDEKDGTINYRVVTVPPRLKTMTELKLFTTPDRTQIASISLRREWTDDDGIPRLRELVRTDLKPLAQSLRSDIAGTWQAAPGTFFFDGTTTFRPNGTFRQTRANGQPATGTYQVQYGAFTPHVSDRGDLQPTGQIAFTLVYTYDGKPESDSIEGVLSPTGLAWGPIFWDTAWAPALTRMPSADKPS